MSEAPQTQPNELPVGSIPESDPNYAANMLARADGKPPVEPENKGEEPKLLAGKYKSVEELEKGYAELLKQRGADSNKKPDEQKPTQADETKPNLDIKLGEEVKKAEEIVEQAGLDWNNLRTEFYTNGQLNDDSYKAIERAGIPRELVDQFISGQQAVAKASRAEVVADTGGEEGYAKMMTWASETLSDAEKKAFNSIVTGTDLAATKIAVSGLYAKFTASGNVEPNLIGGVSAQLDGFKSNAEMMKAMRDPRYENDPAYRKSVMDKLAVSSI